MSKKLFDFGVKTSSTLNAILVFYPDLPGPVRTELQKLVEGWDKINQEMQK